MCLVQKNKFLCESESDSKNRYGYKLFTLYNDNLYPFFGGSVIRKDENSPINLFNPDLFKPFSFDSQNRIIKLNNDDTYHAFVSSKQAEMVLNDPRGLYIFPKCEGIKRVLYEVYGKVETIGYWNCGEFTDFPLPACEFSSFRLIRKIERV